MTENINPFKLFDKNSDWKIEKNELAELWINKSELDKLWIQVELENIKVETLDTIIKKNIPKNYQEEVLGMSKAEKQWYIFLFQLWAKILSKKTIEILAEWNKPLPLDEVTTFLTELVEAEEDKNLLETSTIVLTSDEIKQLKQEIFTENYTKKKLEDFVKEQMNENVSSSEIINWTKLADKLKEAGYDKNFIKNMDTLSSFVFKSDNLSEDTSHNMWTWLTITIARLFNDWKFLNIWWINNLLWFLSGKTSISSKSNNIQEVQNILNTVANIKKAIKKLKINEKNSENIELLMNPEKFSDFLYDSINNKKSEIEIENNIYAYIKSPSKFNNKKEVVSNLKKLFNKIWDNVSVENLQKNKGKMESINTFWNTIRQVKEWINWMKWKTHDWILQNKWMLMWIKETMEELWIWEVVKEIIDKILKFLWFKDGWDDIERNIENKNLFKETIEYFKEKTSLENIKKDKDSIFHKWMKQVLNNMSVSKPNQKIDEVKVKWKFSTNTLYYLSSLGTNKDNLKTNLDNFLKSNNFEKTLDNAWIKIEDFYKKVIWTEKILKDWKHIRFLTINLNEFSKIIEKAKAKEIEKIIEEKAKVVKEKYTSWKWVILDKLPKEEQEKIKSLITVQETNFKVLVKKYFPNIEKFSYNAYLAWIWYIETRNRYNLVNWIWAIWKYQFMPSTLKDYGITDINWFKNNPYLQEQIMAKYTVNQFKTIAKILKKHWIKPTNWADIAFYLAKSHLWWAGAVLKNRSDGNLTQNKYAQNVKNIYKKVA